MKKNRYATGNQYLTPYQKIVRAGKRHTGVRLTVDDVDRMMLDTAILFRAQLDDEERSGEFHDPPAPDQKRPKQTEDQT